MWTLAPACDLIHTVSLCKLSLSTYFSINFSPWAPSEVGVGAGQHQELRLGGQGVNILLDTEMIKLSHDQFWSLAMWPEIIWFSFNHHRCLWIVERSPGELGTGWHSHFVIITVIMDWHKYFLITGEHFVFIFILVWLFVLEDEVTNIAVLTFHADNQQTERNATRLGRFPAS